MVEKSGEILMAEPESLDRSFAAILTPSHLSMAKLKSPLVAR